MTNASRPSALRQAAALLDIGRPREAAARYGELLRGDPDDVRALCGLSRCLGRLGRAGEGLELADRAAALAPAADWPLRLRSAHLLALGRPRQALDAARAAVALDPSGVPALLSLLEAQAAMRDAGGAARTALDLIRCAPDEPEAHNAAGRAAVLGRDWAAAAAAFGQALRLAPQEAVYQSNLALVLERRGRRREAMEHFRRAVQADPGSAVVRRQLAQTVDRRLAVVGLAAGLLAGATVDLLRYAGEPAGWTLAAAPALVGMAAAAGWWRVRRLDDVLRACYRLERLRRWRMRGAV